MILVGFTSATTPAQLFSATLFFPIFGYLWISILPRSTKAMQIPVHVLPHKKKKKTKKDQDVVIELVKEEEPKEGLDIDKRAFIKLIGSAGLSVFILSLFTQKAQAAFFGSVPGPGTVALKDSSGNQIDPAEKQPTDGYKISQLDDSTPAYYGFTNKDGAWFIMKEDSSGNYRYAKGSSSFSTNWTGRALLSYDYFENIF